jgi:hypothetical protein
MITTVMEDKKLGEMNYYERCQFFIDRFNRILWTDLTSSVLQNFLELKEKGFVYCPTVPHLAIEHIQVDEKGLFCIQNRERIEVPALQDERSFYEKSAAYPTHWIRCPFTGYELKPHHEV